MPEYQGNIEIDNDADVQHTGVHRFTSADNFILVDPTDSTKRMKFDLSGLSTGTTDTFAASAGSEVTTVGVQTLSNKTYADPIINGNITGTGVIPNFTIQNTVNAKVGATAGWVVGAASDNAILATLPESQTASTLVIPITGLSIGDTITRFQILGQIESGGNAVTLDANLRKLTATAADIVDASVDSITQISVTADTLVDSSNGSKILGTPELVGADETFYVLVTGTTAGTTDVALIGVIVTVDKIAADFSE